MLSPQCVSRRTFADTAEFLGERPLAYAAAAEIFALVSRGPRGSDTQTTVPLPSFERSRIEPPCRLVSERAMASPSPEP